MVTERFSPAPGCTTTSVIFPVGCNSLTTTAYSNTIIATSSVDCHSCCKIQLLPLGHCFIPLTFPTTITAATPTTRTRTVCIRSAEASCEPTPGALDGARNAAAARQFSDSNLTGTLTSYTSAHPSINSTLKVTPHLPPKQTSTSTRRLPPGVGTETIDVTLTTVTDE